MVLNNKKEEKEELATTKTSLVMDETIKTSQALTKQIQQTEASKQQFQKVDYAMNQLEGLSKEKWDDPKTKNWMQLTFKDVMGDRTPEEMKSFIEARKATKKELNKYAPGDVIPEDLKKRANELGFEPDKHTNLWLGGLKGITALGKMMAEGHVSAMEAAGEAQPNSIYGGVGQMAKNRKEQEKIAKEQAEKNKLFVLLWYLFGNK
jgi:hypothetical protein